MGKTRVLVAMLAFLGGCASINYHPPEQNRSPQAKFTIVGHKHPDLEVQLRLVLQTKHEDCSEKRPMTGGTFARIVEDGRLTFAAGAEEFTAELFLDKYLPGHCEWHPIAIQVRANRPPHGLLDSWVHIAVLNGNRPANLDNVPFVCKRPNPKSNNLWCHGPATTLRVSPVSGQIRASFVIEGGSWYSTYGEDPAREEPRLGWLAGSIFMNPAESP